MNKRIQTHALKSNVAFFKTSIDSSTDEKVVIGVLKFDKIDHAEHHLTDERMGLMSFAYKNNSRKYYVVDKRWWVTCIYPKKPKKHFHEHFLRNRNMKLVFDLEIKGLDKLDEDERREKVGLFNEVKRDLIKYTTNLLRTCFGETVDDGDFLCLTASSPTVKLSEHIILEGGIYFMDIYTIHRFMYLILQYIYRISSDEVKKAIREKVWDTQIYRPNGSLKIAYSINNGETDPNRMLRPYDNPLFDTNIVKRSLIQYGTPRVVLEINETPKKYIEKLTLEIEKAIFGTASKSIGDSFDADEIDLNDDDKEMLNNMLNSIKDKATIDPVSKKVFDTIKDTDLEKPYEIKRASIAQPNTLILRVNPSSYCFIKKGYHHNASPTFYFMGENMIVNCFSAHCKCTENWKTNLDENQSAIIYDILSRYGPNKHHN
jgi:hypothetical protein